MKMWQCKLKINETYRWRTYGLQLQLKRTITHWQSYFIYNFYIHTCLQSISLVTKRQGQLFRYQIPYNYILKEIFHYLFPVSEVGDNFKGFGQFSTAIPLKNRSHTFVHVNNSVVQLLHLYTGIILGNKIHQFSFYIIQETHTKQCDIIRGNHFHLEMAHQCITW